MTHAFIYLNSISWEPTWSTFRQRVQNIARELARMGHPGIFVNGLGVADKAISEVVEAGPDAVSAAVRSYIEERLREPAVLPNLRVISPPDSPDHPGIRKVFLKELLSLMAEENPIVYYSTPFHWVDELDVIPREVPVIYDCADEHSAFSYAGLLDLANENRLVASADLVICSAARLMVNKLQLNERVYYLPNAVDPDYFSGDAFPPTDLADIPRPVIGFVGGVSEWVDLDLVAHLARTYPDCSVVLIGPVDSQVYQRLTRLPNVHLLGSRPYNQVYRYLTNFDVGIIPFKVNELTLSVSPLKLYEYLAAGLPTVTTNLPEIYPYKEIACIARTNREFVELVGDLLRDPPSREYLRRAAGTQTWQSRANQVVSIVDQHAGCRENIDMCHQLTDLRSRYESVVHSESDSVAVVELCRLLWTLGEHERVFDYADQAVGLDDVGQEAILFRALGHLSAGASHAALDDVRRYADLCQEENQVRAYDLRQLCNGIASTEHPPELLQAVLLRRLRLYRDALDILNSLPATSAVILERAHLLFTLGYFDLAVDTYALLDDPWVSAECCMNLLVLSRKLRHPDLAEKALLSLMSIPELANQAERSLADLYLQAAVKGVREPQTGPGPRLEPHPAVNAHITNDSPGTNPERSLNIAISVDRLEMGGLETHILGLCQGLVERKHRVTVVCTRVSDHMVKQLSDLRVQIASDIPYSIDVLHLHPFEAIAQGCVFAQKHRRPVVTTYHGVYDDYIGLAVRSGPVIAVSREGADFIRGKTGVQARVIENGIDLSAFSAAERGPSLRQVLWLGRLDEPERTVFVRRLVEEARNEGLRLLVAGSPVPPGCEHMPEFLGARWDVPQLLRQTDAVLATGRGIREAMASGCAAVVCNHVGYGGLVTPDNVEALRRANFSGRGEPLPNARSVVALCKRLLDDHSWAREVQEWSAAYAKEHFGLDRMVDQTVATYHEAIRMAKGN